MATGEWYGRQRRPYRYNHLLPNADSVYELASSCERSNSSVANYQHNAYMPEPFTIHFVMLLYYDSCTFNDIVLIDIHYCTLPFVYAGFSIVDPSVTISFIRSSHYMRSAIRAPVIIFAKL